jgi:hypothetical protein
MNLHDIVRSGITAVNRDQAFTLYRSLGTFTRDYETMTNTPDVAPGVSVKGQIQSLEADKTVQSERITHGTTVRRLYLYAPHDPALRPWGLWRPLARIGDYIDDELGNRWQVDAVLEDFSAEGWVSLQIILQTTPQALNIKDEAQP